MFNVWTRSTIVYFFLDCLTDTVTPFGSTLILQLPLPVPFLIDAFVGRPILSSCD